MEDNDLVAGNSSESKVGSVATSRVATEPPLSVHSGVSRCFSFYTGIRKRGYALMSMHGPKLSIEQKIAMTFAPALKASQNRRWSSSNKEQRPTEKNEGGGAASIGSEGLVCTQQQWEQSPVVVDVGVNDGEDIHSWFSEFGRWSDSCTTYFLVEPQSQYWAQIALAVRQHYLNQSLKSPAAARGSTLVMDHLTDESPVFFGPRGVSGVQRRIALFRAAVGPTTMHNHSAVLRGAGQSASIEKIDEDRVAVQRGTSTIRMLSLLYILNNFTSERQHVTFMKIDCEGADAVILVSSEPLFAKQRVDFVMFELNKVIRTFPVQYGQAIAMLRRHKYVCFVVGYDRSTRSLMLSEIDEHRFAYWRPKLETMVCIPSYLLQGDSSQRLLPNGLVPGAVELSATDKKAYLGRMLLGQKKSSLKKGIDFYSSQCFGRMYQVPCNSCGHERFV